MRNTYQVCALTAVLLLTTMQVQSDDVFNIGGDVYSSGSDITASIASPRDIFLAGYSVNLNADVAGDAHAAGFNVEINAGVGGNLYVAASNVEIDSSVDRDLTVSGFSVELDNSARVGGNARIVGASVSIDGQLEGALLVSGGSIKLNATVAGDVRLSASKINFGENARIAGTLNYSAPEPLDIPESVIASSRVTFQPLSRSDIFDDMHKTMNNSLPGFWPSLAGRLIGLLVLLAFLLIISAVFLAFMPNKVEQLHSTAREHGWRSIAYGFLGLSTLIGAIPLSGMTIVGIPILPLLVLALVLFWMMGYLLGVYVIAMRVWRSMEIKPGAVFAKLLILASGLVAMTIVNLIPLLGWIINLGVMLFGLGAMSYLFIERLVRRHDNVRSDSRILLTDDRG